MRRLCVAIVLGAALAPAGEAAAQFVRSERPERPYRGIFASGVPSDVEQSLSVSGSLGAGYDSSVLAEAADSGLGIGTGVPTESEGGGYGLAAGSINYSRNKPRRSFGASGAVSSRYYPTVGDSFVTSYSGGAGFSWAATRRSTIGVNGSVSYQPFSLYSLFPEFRQAPLGYVFITDLDFNSLQRGYFNYAASFDYARQLTRRSSLSGGYSYYRSDFAPEFSDFWSQTGNIRYTRTVSEALGLRLGYGYTRGHYGGADPRPIDQHHIDAGVDYRKAFSLSRRTTFSFSTGGSAVRNEESTQFGAIGSANLNHEIGRSWNLYAAYNRNIGFVETFASPFFYDAVGAGLTGLISPRLEFHSGVGASTGTVGFGNDAPDDNGFDTIYASAGLSMALNRHLSMGLDYSLYRYDFDRNALLPDGFEHRLNRHSVRFTLNAWAPLLPRGRRGNAAR